MARNKKASKIDSHTLFDVIIPIFCIILIVGAVFSEIKWYYMFSVFLGAGLLFLGAKFLAKEVQKSQQDKDI